MKSDKDTEEVRSIIEEVIPPIECLNKLENCKSIFDLDLQTFCRLLMVLNPQKRTALIEKKLKFNFGWNTVNPSLERGDYIDKNNKYFELKTSCPNSSNKIMIRQVRIWQNVDYYLILYIDCFNLNNSQAFILTKDQMAVEACEKGTGSHKTKASSQGDEKRELSFTISVDKNATDNKEWTKLYGANNVINDILTI